MPKSLSKETRVSGTEATRAKVLETLKERGYLALEKVHRFTPLGREIIDLTRPRSKTPLPRRNGSPVLRPSPRAGNARRLSCGAKKILPELLAPILGDGRPAFPCRFLRRSWTTAGARRTVRGSGAARRIPTAGHPARRPRQARKPGPNPRFRNTPARPAASRSSNNSGARRVLRLLGYPDAEDLACRSGRRSDFNAKKERKIGGRCGALPHSPAKGMMPLDPHCRNTWQAMCSEMRGSGNHFPRRGFGVEPQIEKGDSDMKYIVTFLLCMALAEPCFAGSCQDIPRRRRQRDSRT